MQRVCALLFSVLLVPAAVSAGEKPAKQVEVSWHGQSFFTVTTSKGKVVVFDPHAISEYGRVQGMKGDIVLMSHWHNDHTHVGVLENAKDKNLKVIPGWKGAPNQRAPWNLVDEKIGDVHIRSVGVYHDDVQGMKYGRNVVFIVEVDGWKIVHLGDLGHTLSREQIRDIGPVDVLMIPVGGIYALNGAQAKRVVEQLKPREYIFPMHMGTKVYDVLLTADEFFDGVEPARLARHDDNRIRLNRDPTRPRPLVVDLQFWPKGSR